MVDHYYTQEPSIGHDRQYIEETIKNVTMKFVTDAGVFSKKKIDLGSRFLIENMELPKTAHVLDIGCGYGPIGLFASAFLVEGRVTMVDINERAVELARENAEINKAKNVRILQSDLYAKLENEKFTTILTNPPIRAGKDVVHKIYEQAVDHLEPGGQLWIVLQKKQGAPSSLIKLQQLFNEVKEIAKHKGFRIYKAVHAKKE